MRNILYIITGQKLEYWGNYFLLRGVVYNRFIIMLKRGFYLLPYYIRSYGQLLGLWLVLNHLRVRKVNVPFRYYSSIEWFIIRNILMLIIIAVLLYTFYMNFDLIKFIIVKNCPDTKNIYYLDMYYPYSIFLVTGIILVVQLMLLSFFKTLRLILNVYKKEFILLNLISIFVLITVHCTVAYEGIFCIWWLPEGFKPIEFEDSYSVHAEFLRYKLYDYYINLINNEKFINLKNVYESMLVLFYKFLWMSPIKI